MGGREEALYVVYCTMYTDVKENLYIRKPLSYMTLQLLRSEFPYISGKFSFLFYQCTVHCTYNFYISTLYRRALGVFQLKARIEYGPGAVPAHITLSDFVTYF